MINTVLLPYYRRGFMTRRNVERQMSSPTVPVTVKIDRQLYDAIEFYITQSRFSNRSHAINEAIYQFLWMIENNPAALKQAAPQLPPNYRPQRGSNPRLPR